MSTPSAPGEDSDEPAGIEGEPILLGPGAHDPKFNDYLNRVRQMIYAKWAYPCVTEKRWGLPDWCDYKNAQLVIDFGILEDGRVSYVIVRKPAEFAVYNDSAVAALKLAAPFPPIPEPLLDARKGLPIRATFNYVKQVNP